MLYMTSQPRPQGEGFWKRLYSLKFMFNSYGATFALIICFWKLFISRTLEFRKLSLTHSH